MPDYTEEDVERAASAIWHTYSVNSEGARRWPDWADVAETMKNEKRAEARAALEAVDLYTAGALAMKEAAAVFAETRAEPDAAIAIVCRGFADGIRALPVPPRGSKI